MEPQIRFCTSADGTRIAYATMGEGPPLVVSAGWADNLELEWQDPLGRAFLEGLGRGRLLVRFDRRGVGASQREVGDLSLEAQVADLTAVVDELQLELFGLVAWAESGAMAVAYAARNPERVSRLVLDRLSQKVGFKLSAHRFRHSFTTMMLRRGCDLETLRQMGGWSSYTMLMTYTHLAADDLKRAHATRSPLDNL